MKYSKTILTPSTTVAGNIRDFKQSYDIKYYPRDKDLVDKVALYIYLGDYAKRSVYFSSHEQLKQLILDLTNSYFYFRDKRFDPVISEQEFRLITLDIFTSDLRKRQLAIWKNE